MWCATSAPQLMARVREQLDREAQAFGITVVDVRIRRADLPEQNSQAVYQRMQTERQREAAEFRAKARSARRRSGRSADRDVTVLVAEAQSKGEQIRGEGDAERNRIFAEAFGKDPDFFAFYRSMQAYESGLRANDTRMVLKPDRTSSAISPIRPASRARAPSRGRRSAVMRTPAHKVGGYASNVMERMSPVITAAVGRRWPISSLPSAWCS